MLSGSAVPLSHDACTAGTHIFSDRPLIRLQIVKAQELYRHCPRSALFISASRYTHLAFAPVSALIGCLLKPPPLVATGSATARISSIEVTVLGLGPNYRRVPGAGEVKGARSHEGTTLCCSQDKDARSWLKDCQSEQYPNSAWGIYQQEFTLERCQLFFGGGKCKETNQLRARKRECGHCRAPGVKNGSTPSQARLSQEAARVTSVVW
jgi:hypothetical protein